MKKTAVLILVLCCSSLSYGQFGDLLKNQGLKLAKKEGKKLLSKELNETKAKFDSASFSYAVSLSDKAAQFESKEKGADVLNLATMVVDEEKDKTSLEVARDYMDVGEMLYSTNQFKAAEGFFLSANAILITESAESNPLYGRGLANLGLLYNSMGRYGAAEELTRTAMNIREKYLGRQSKDFAASLNNMAVLNKDLGNYNEAEKEISEAVDINLEVLGNESIAYAIGLNNRGVLYQTLGRYDDAERDFVKSLEVALKSLSAQSIQYTRFQVNLALLYQQEGKYDASEKIYQEAINAIAKNPMKSKKSNPDSAHMIENLGALYEIMGRFDEAEDLYLEALAVYDRKFGDQYSGYGLASARLGALYLTTDKLDNAEKYLEKAESVLASTYGSQHPNTVDTQVQLGVLNWKKGNPNEANKHLTKALDKSLEFVGSYFAPMSDTEKALYWKTLRPRFETYYAFAASADDEKVLNQAAEYRLFTKAMLLSGTTKVKNQILNSGDASLIEDYRTWLDQKGSLAHYYAMSREELRDQKINLDSINTAANNLEKSLSERSGLFTQAYQQDVPQLDDIQAELNDQELALEFIRIDKANHNELSYLVLVVSSSGVDKVNLSDGASLEDKYFKLYRNLIKYKKADLISYKNYWQEIDAKLGDTKKVYLSLDGVFNQISIGSLQSSENSYLLDRREFTTISSLRDITNLAKEEKAVAKHATLMGNPTYGGDAIAPLPGTGVEVNAIKATLTTGGYKTNIKTGTEASESFFKEADHSGIIHIATHGFFVADPSSTQTSVFSVPLYNVNESVLLRSGLLFAGAGTQEPAISAVNAANNGVLTSYEVMNMNLDNTNLIVLSACETGLGDVMAGEGVYGLQRAFLIAGASNLVMSLWKVDDAATQELMVSFYKNWLATGNMETSFAKAQRTVRDKYNHPYYWGAFVLLKN